MDEWMKQKRVDRPITLTFTGAISRYFASPTVFQRRVGLAAGVAAFFCPRSLFSRALSDPFCNGRGYLWSASQEVLSCSPPVRVGQVKICAVLHENIDGGYQVELHSAEKRYL